MQLTAIIPAHNPPAGLVGFVTRLAASDFARIIVVNDGSPSSCDPIFQAIERVEKVTLLRHAVNLGKGAALKTGFNHVCCYLGNHIGVVTIDADGQHLLEDALKVADVLKSHPENFVMGVRTFGKNVPLRSKIGNIVTSFLFRLLIGQKLTDTQSGLRGLPKSFLPGLLKIGSNGFEFDLDTLLAWKYTGRKIIERPIQTVYIKGNESSHFNPIADSMKIYFTLFRFTLASLSSALIDYTIFILIYSLSSNLLAGQSCARLVSMLYNYSVVKKLVFFPREETFRTFPKYVALVFFSGSISYLLIKVLTTFSPLPVIVAKAIVESMVFLANFAIQRDFIFVKNTDLKTQAQVETKG
jgi:glycosyltransferase involved in cell wall biosynthesis